MLQCPPRLILINQGGYFTMLEAVAGLAALPRITEVGNRATHLRGHFGNAVQKILCSSDHHTTCLVTLVLCTM
jgi:hypothetical protein